MKANYILIVLLFVGFFSQAQSVATIGKVEVSSMSIDAVTIEFPLSSNDMEKIFEKKMITNGAPKNDERNKAFKGFRYYPATNLTPVSDMKLDYYYQVDGNRQKTKITMFFSRGYDNLLTTTSDAAVFNNAKTFLESINNEVGNFQWEERVKTQEDVVKSETKSKVKLDDRVKDLESDMEKLKKKIEDAKQELSKQTDIQKQAEQKLETIKTEKK